MRTSNLGAVWFLWTNC